ncbi:MAG: PAS domain-containing sensor histidine kinase [Miltoncostaeaceae bacterium]
MIHPSDDIEILTLLAESANDVIWKMAVTGEITYVSPSVERMRGITPEEAMAQPLDAIMTPESSALTLQYFTDLYSALAEGREPPPTYWGEREYYCKDGSTVWTEVYVIPRYDDTGAMVEILGVTRDASDRKRQERLLQEAQDQAAAARVEAERERATMVERERIARDLHDDLLQTLAAVRADIATLGLTSGNHDAAMSSLERSKDDLGHALDAARRLVTGLRPKALDDQGLVSALDALAIEFTARTGVACDVTCDEIPDVMPAESECLFRVAQEALANVAKHANASSVQIALTRPQPDRLVLRVADNGTGLDTSGANAPSDGVGIIGMRERVQMVGGAIRIEGRPGGGTTVEAAVPIAA